MGLAGLTKALPWPLKVAAKVVLTRLPVPYALWRRTALFRHGAMDDPATALTVVRGAVEGVGRQALTGARVLELGPGDALASAVIAHALGAASVSLVDQGAFATTDMATYRRLVAHLVSVGLPVGALAEAPDLASLLAACVATYDTQGLVSLEALPAGSIDFAFSNAALEHVRLAEVPATLAALNRVMAPGGVQFHRVDLKDHLAYALNNLRFSAGLWESAFMARSGFYTNRLRLSGWLEHCQHAGFRVDIVAVRRFAALPTPRAALAPAFRHLSDDELLVAGFDMVLSRA